VLVAGLVITAALTVSSRVSYVHSEQRLTALQTQLTGDALAVAPIDLERRLGQAVNVAAEAPAPVAVFRRVLGPSVGPTGPFVRAALWLVEGSNAPRLLASLGAKPLLNPSSASSRATLRHAASTRGLLTQWVHTPTAQRLAYEMSAPSRRGVLVVTAGQQLPGDRRLTVSSNSPDAALDIALYFGKVATPSALIESNAPHLPLSGIVSTAHVQLGDSVLTLVASPNSPLAGRFSQLVPWGILVLGLLFSAGIALMTERLVRRREFAETLAGENRRLYHEQRHVAVTLQHSLLPQTLPVHEGIQLAARYVPGTAGIDVGGDWYDVVELPGGRLFFTVGDVAGRGLGAASLMARLRNAVNTLALDGADPATVLTKVSRQVDAGSDGRFATVLCGRLDPASGELLVSSAGHPPPLLVRGTEPAERQFLAVTTGPPIGLGAHSYGHAGLRLGAGDTLLCYTDGLVERRGELLDTGLERLRRAAGAAGDPQALLDAVVAALATPDAPDDVALLALRLTAPVHATVPEQAAGTPGSDPLAGAPAAWPALRAAFDASPALVTVFTGSARVLAYQNPASARFGARAIGSDPAGAFPEYADWFAALAEVWDRREPFRLPAVPRRLGARHTALEVTGAPIFADPEPGRDGGTAGPPAVWGVVCQAVEVDTQHLDDEQLRRALLLARATSELTRSLQPLELAGAITRLGSELFGCACILNLYEDDAVLRRVSATSHDPSLQAALDELVRLSCVSGLARSREGRESVALEVARRGEAVMGHFDTDELISIAPTADHVRALSTLRPSAYLVLPVRVGERRLGALTLLRSGDEAVDFTLEDRFAAELLAERAAVALSQARDYDEQRQAVLTLQQALLQPVPATVPGVAVAVRYRPGGSGAHVGGDWYDVFPLRDGALGVVVGDVEGHDLRAAAAMSQVRSVVHSHARAGLPPGLVVEHANRFVCEQQPRRLVTMTVVQLYPSERLMIWSRAGHLPVVSACAGSSEVHGGGGGLPLGVRPEAHWPEQTTRLPPGALAALFTNGLLAADASDADGGLAALATRLAEPGAGHDLDRLADGLADLAAPGSVARADDRALVLLRLEEPADAGRRRVTRQLPPVAASAAIARHFLGDLLPHWGVAEGPATVSALLVSELVTNATRHTDGPIELRVELGRRLRIEVYDDSHRLPERRHAALDDTAGRGLELVELLSADWGVAHERSGKAVWFELDLEDVVASGTG
jgi:serine phosphatase RsbU (regulator of sigma subunit)